VEDGGSGDVWRMVGVGMCGGWWEWGCVEDGGNKSEWKCSRVVDRKRMLTFMLYSSGIVISKKNLPFFQNP
jgi:hypothetical protein